MSPPKVLTNMYKPWSFIGSFMEAFTLSLVLFLVVVDAFI